MEIEGKKISGLFVSWGGLLLGTATALGVGMLGFVVGFNVGSSEGSKEAAGFKARLAALEARVDARGDVRNIKSPEARA